MHSVCLSLKDNKALGSLWPDDDSDGNGQRRKVHPVTEEVTGGGWRVPSVSEALATKAVNLS